MKKHVLSLKLGMILVLTLVLVLSCKTGKKGDTSTPDAAEISNEEQVDETQGATITELTRIHFDYDRYSIRDDAVSTLMKNAEYLKQHPDVWIQIEGHCDERGSAEYNLALGDKRANAAKRYLIDLGIKANRISVISYGEEKPLRRSSDESSWSMNRRAEFIIVSQGM